MSTSTAAIVATLEAVAPEFVGDERVAVFVAIAERHNSPTAWGDAHVDAVAFYAAHLLTRSKATAAASAAAADTAGPVTSRSAGAVSESYGALAGGAANAADAELLTTRYGAAYLRLRASRAARLPRVVSL